MIEARIMNGESEWGHALLPGDNFPTVEYFKNGKLVTCSFTKDSDGRPVAGKSTEIIVAYPGSLEFKIKQPTEFSTFPDPKTFPQQ